MSANTTIYYSALVGNPGPLPDPLHINMKKGRWGGARRVCTATDAAPKHSPDFRSNPGILAWPGLASLHYIGFAGGANKTRVLLRQRRAFRIIFAAPDTAPLYTASLSLSLFDHRSYSKSRPRRDSRPGSLRLLLPLPLPPSRFFWRTGRRGIPDTATRERGRKNSMDISDRTPISTTAKSLIPS